MDQGEEFASTLADGSLIYSHGALAISVPTNAQWSLHATFTPIGNVILVQVLANPFDDVMPRSSAKNKTPEGPKKKKSRMKATK